MRERTGGDGKAAGPFQFRANAPGSQHECHKRGGRQQRGNGLRSAAGLGGAPAAEPGGRGPLAEPDSDYHSAIPDYFKTGVEVMKFAPQQRRFSAWVFVAGSEYPQLTEDLR